MPLKASAQIGTVGMAGTPHDLSAGNVTNTETDRVCVFCHLPHNADATVNRIWNRNITNTSYGAGSWGSATPTIAGTTLPEGANTVGAGSIRCFSCHDGSATLGVMLNSPTGADLTTMSATAVGATYTIDPDAMAGNHPVSVPYPGSVYNGLTSQGDTNKYYDPATEVIPAATVQIYGGTNTYGIECGSCHEPHDTTWSYFLREDIGGSTLCVNCHAK